MFGIDEGQEARVTPLEGGAKRRFQGLQPRQPFAGNQAQVQRIEMAFSDLSAAGARRRRAPAQIIGLQQEGLRARRARW